MVLRHRRGRPPGWMLAVALLAGLAFLGSFTWIQCRQADRAAERMTPDAP